MAPALTTEIELSTIDFPLLGWHIMYLINQVEIPYQAFQKLLDQHGFTGYQIEPVGETVALQRAVTRWVDDRAKHGKGPRRTRWVMDPDTEIRQQALIRSVAVPKASPFLVFALVTESSDATLADLNYDTDLRIVLDKTTGQLVCSRAAGSLILETPTPLKRPRGRPRKDEIQASLAANRKVARDILKGVQRTAQDQAFTNELRPFWILSVICSGPMSARGSFVTFLPVSTRWPHGSVGGSTLFPMTNCAPCSSSTR